MSETVKVVLEVDEDAHACLWWDSPAVVNDATAATGNGGLYEIPREQHERWQETMRRWQAMQDEIDGLMRARREHLGTRGRTDA
jgi:hypothetical protein